MIRRLCNAWMVLCALWIAYASAHAIRHWLRWGDFISPENRAATLAQTGYDILALPLLSGLVLVAVAGLVRAVRSRRSGCR